MLFATEQPVSMSDAPTARSYFIGDNYRCARAGSLPGPVACHSTGPPQIVARKQTRCFAVVIVTNAVEICI